MDHPSRTFKPDAYRQKIQELLANLPERAQVAIAARCAWRVMPLLAGSSQKWELKPLRDIAAAASVAALIGDGFDRYAAYGLSAARAASAAISSNIPESPLSVSDFAASGAGSSASLAAFAAFVAFGSVTTDAASIILRTTANAARTVALIANSLYKKDDFDLFLIEVLQSTESDIQRISSFPGDDKFGTSFHFLYDGEVPQGIVNAWRQSCEKLGDAGDEIFRLWESFYRGRVNWPEVGDFFLRWLHERENSDDRPSTANNAVPPEATDPLPKPSPSEPPSPPPKPPGFRFDSDPAGIAPDSPQGDIQGRALECCLALRDFLLHKNTAAPLTVAVEAPWGAGKSSVMLCLRNHLETKKIPTVWFNPWQYEAGKALWAAFALAFERQLAGRYLPPRRFWKRASLAVRRMTGKEWIIFVFHLAAWGLIFAALWWLLNHNWTGQDKDGRAMSWEQVLSNLFAPNSWQGHAVKGLIALAVFLPFLKEIVAKLGSPFKSELSKLYGSGSYTEQMGELYRFHEDFRRMLFSYAPGVRLRYLQAYLSWWFRKVLAKLRRKKWEEGTFPHPEAPKIVVFIDDLDRCEAPKVAELLQSLHLMMNGDESGNLRPHWGITRWLLTHWNNLKKRLGWQFKPPGLFYILGMDREKVAAAVAAKHAALLPLLEDPDKNGKISRAQVMHFGREYLEKFVHLTLHLPRMEGTDLDAFVLKVCGIEHSQLESQREEAIQARKSDPSAPKLSVGNSDKPQILAQDGPKDSAIGRIVDLEASAGRVIDGISRPSREKIDRVDNVESVGACARMVAPALEWNPRRIKQFINLLRLRIHLTGRMGFLELNADAKDDETKMSGGLLSIYHLAKLIALELAFPEMMSEARESDNPLESLKTLIANRRDETSLHHILLLLSSKAGAEWLPESNAADPFNRALKEDLQNAEKESRYDLSAANLRAYFHYVAASEEAPASVSSQT